MSKTDRIIQLFFTQSPAESIRKNFFIWLKAPSASAEKEKVIKHIWNSLHIEADHTTENSYKQVEKRLGFVTRKRTGFPYIRLARIAAIFLIPLLSVFAAWRFVHNQQEPEFVMVEHFVPDGETKTLILPDKSIATINSGSTLFYPAGLKGKNRVIYLNGEAKFNVAPDKQKPFVVKTNDMNIEALGTVFNISSYSDNLYTTATLAEGKIKVDIKSTNESFILESREQIRFDKNAGSSLRRKVRLDYVLAWEKRQMVFQKASLYEIVKEIERRYNVTVYLNSKAWDQEIITVKFLHNETLEETLSVLKHIITGFNYEIKEDKIYVYCGQ